MRPLSRRNVSKSWNIKSHSVAVLIFNKGIVIPNCGYRKILTGQNHSNSEAITILKIRFLICNCWDFPIASLIKGTQMIVFPLGWDWKLMGPQIILEGVAIFILDIFPMHPLSRGDVTEWGQYHPYSPAIFILLCGLMILSIRDYISHGLFEDSRAFILLVAGNRHFVLPIKIL